MGINVESKVTKNLDAAESVRVGLEKHMKDAADTGFEVSQEHVPHGADSFLANSGFVPEWRGDRIVWGYTADYAEPVEDGSVPHWIPVGEMHKLEKWARRVLGDENAAWAVRHKIGPEGTDAQPIIEPGKQAQERYAKAVGIDTYVEREIGKHER